jgi:hypothetical protein
VSTLLLSAPPAPSAFRETRLYQVAPISTNLILCFLAERALGLPKSYG